MLPRANLLAPKSDAAAPLAAAGVSTLRPIKHVRRSTPSVQQTGENPSNAAASSSSATASSSAVNLSPTTSNGNGKEDSNLEELLAIVRQRYGATQTEPSASTAEPDAPPSSEVKSPPSPGVDESSTSSATFTDAAAAARADKLAILMSLFKSRGIEAPPLPLFEKIGGPSLPMPPLPPASATIPPGRTIATAAASASLSAPPAAPSASASAATMSTAHSGAPKATPASPKPIAERADSPTDQAEIAQLTALFQHARAKIMKLCRLYQSGILKGAGAQQAVEKLSGLLRTYYGFIQQAKSHKHISAMDEEIMGDVACSSTQALSDRMYALAKS